MFCNHCKTKADDGQKFCSSCGKSLIPGVSTENRVIHHLKPLGVFWIVFSSFRLIGAVATLVVGVLVIPFLTSEFPIAESILRTVISLVGGGLLLTAMAGLAAGFGLLGRRPWARLLAVIMAFLFMLEIPYGTLLGIYTLWVLLSAEREEEYKLMVSGA